MKNFYKSKYFLVTAIVFLLCSFFVVKNVLATAGVSPASGGDAISADTAGIGYATLTGPIITESAVGDIGTGTIVLTAPTGFRFNTTTNSVQVVRATAGNCNGNGNHSVLISGAASANVTPTASTITITISQASSGNAHCVSTLTFSGIRVQPTASNPLASGNITNSGTALINGVDGSTNFGTLTEIAGSLATITVSPTGPQSVKSGETLQFTASGFDAHGNLVTITPTWSVVAGTGTGSINATGLFTAGNIGNVKVRATSGTITGDSDTITIPKTDQTINFSPILDKTYGDSDFLVSATASSGLDVSLSSETLSTCTISAGTIHILKAGECTIRASQSGDDNYNSAPNVDRTFNINPLAIVLAGGKAYDGLATADFSILSITNKIGSDEVNLVSGAVGLASKNVGSQMINSPGTLALAGAEVGNYTTSGVSGNVAINKISITVTATHDEKIYNGSVDSLATPAITSGALQGSDTSNFVEVYDNKNIGTEKTLTPSGNVNDGNGGNNYDVTFINDATGVITVRPLTVTATTDTKAYDGTTTSSAIPTITSGSLAGSDTATWTQEFDNKNVGINKTLIPSGNVNDGNGGSNYEVTFVVSTLGAINTRAITITADAKSKTYGDPDPELTYAITSGSLVDSDALFGSLSRDAGEDVGSYSITLGSLANENYAITFVGNTLLVSPKAVLTIKADSKSITYGDSEPSFTFSYEGFKNEDDASTIDTPPTCSVSVAHSNVGTYPIICSGGSDNNYDFNYVSNTLVIGKKTINVTADTKSKTYGDTSDPELAYTNDPLIEGDSFSGVLTRQTGENAGTYPITQGTLSLSDNYTINFTGADFTINKRPLTVTATTDTKAYDGTTTSSAIPTITSGSLAGSDTATWTQEFDNKNVGINKTLIPSGSVSDGNGGSNYEVTFVISTTGVITGEGGNTGGGNESTPIQQNTNNTNNQTTTEFPPQDINHDGNVDELDFAILMSQWGQTGTDLSADLNKDGVVDELDFAILMANWNR